MQDTYKGEYRVDVIKPSGPYPYAVFQAVKGHVLDPDKLGFPKGQVKVVQTFDGISDNAVTRVQEAVRKLNKGKRIELTNLLD